MAKHGFRIFDSDIHIIEPGDLYQRFIEDSFKDRAPFKERSMVSGVDKWVVDGIPHPYWVDWPQFLQANLRLENKKEATPFQVKAYERGFDAETTLEAMDLEGVDVSVLFRTHGIIGQAIDTLEPVFGLALCRAYNNWLSDYCKTNPERMKGAGLIPLHDIDMAIEEARRVVLELGFPAVSIHPEPVNDRVFYDTEVEPLWDELERLGVAACFHGTSTGPSTHDFSRKYLGHPAGRTFTHALSFPTQMMTAIAGMTLSGVLERHPRLRVGFLEANCAWIPWLLYRLDDQWHKYADSPLEKPPSDYFLRQCVASADADEYLIEDVIRRIGDHHLVLSTDYPHPDSAFPNAIHEFMELEVSDASRRKILWDNSARLYGIEVPAKA
ncbi:MAG: putative metal-dependent hydrolase, TIM-barrel fold [Chloroflexi bacterium]|nr:MAG: putative metal-dependent hydrolase, TIM-barrel fold [Chloroflexota bacterium]